MEKFVIKKIRLTAGPHEVIDMSKELARQPDSDICETVVLPDTEDPYGGANCVCSCHDVENPKFKSRSQHCKDCGLKVYFFHGKFKNSKLGFLVYSRENLHSDWKSIAACCCLISNKSRERSHEKIECNTEKTLGFQS